MRQGCVVFSETGCVVSQGCVVRQCKCGRALRSLQLVEHYCPSSNKSPGSVCANSALLMCA